MMWKKLKVIKKFGKAKQENAIAFSICAYSEAVSKALSEQFKNVDQVEIVQGNILHSRSNALVSPANSFGEMSGGLDKEIDDYFHGNAQKESIKIIREKYLGELPVGMGQVIRMDDKKFTHLILAPTMRIPSNESNSINAYLAMRGLLVAIAQYNRTSEEKIKSVVIPSLCTGVGGMSARQSAEQMHTAFNNVVMSGWENVKHPAMAPYAISKM